MTLVILILVSAAASGAFFLLALLPLTRRHAQLKKEYDDLQGQLKHEISAHLRTITELERSQTLHEKALTQHPVTDLPTRVVFEDRLTQVGQQSKRYQLTFAVLLLKLDQFEMIASAMGYANVEGVLKEVSARMQTCIRTMDILCGFASHTFALLLPQLTKAETAAFVAQRLLDVIAKPFMMDGQEVFLTASIGISIFPSDGEDATTLIRHADTALQQARLRNSNTYQFYRQEMYVLGRRELLLASRLRSDNIFSELSIRYQPVFNVVTKNIIAMEALLQWQHSDMGVITSAEFLLHAENSGRIVAIGEWVLREVCQQLQRWQLAGFYPASVAVNVSLRQLESPRFIHTVSQILQEYAMQPEQLVIEISESVISPKVDLIDKTLKMLKHLGVRLVMDHFGASQVLLQHLRRFPVDMLKIDSSLVQGVAGGGGNDSVIKTILGLADSLNLVVAADGVETAAQKELLLALGCQQMQGSLFGQPVLPTELNELSLKEIDNVM